MTDNIIYKGFNYISDYYGAYDDANGEGTSQFNGVLADNANAVALTLDFGIDAGNNTVVDDDGDEYHSYTETNSDLATTINDAETAGLTVLLRPLIDFLPDGNNGDYYNDEFRNYYDPGAAGSAGANSFFESYTTMIVDEAKVAQTNHVPIFDIGTELDQITGPAYASYWDTLIADVKDVYTGKLTYSAVWDDSQGYWTGQNSDFVNDGQTGTLYVTGTFATQVDFWSQMDYIGIDEYAAISDSSNPDTLSVAQLEAGWTQIPTDPVVKAVTGNQSLIDYYETLSADLGKPLLFTELGYPDSSDAAEYSASPGYGANGQDGTVADPALQSKLYQAFFDAWESQGNPSLAGVFVWEYEPDGAAGSVVQANTPLYTYVKPGDYYEENYNPYVVQNESGNTAIADGFAECFCAGTRIATPDGERAVEALREGDEVSTLHRGARAIKRITRRSYDGRFVKGNHLILPVHIKAGAFGPGVPARELRVSPGHGIHIGGVLVPAWRLVDGVSVTQAPADGVFHYFHLELEGHEVLLAEGCPAESYYDAEAAAPGALTRVESGFVMHGRGRVARGRRLIGTIEQAGEGRCTGWVRDIDDGDAPVALDILCGGRRVARVLANGFRADVRKAGYGSGCHGFDVTLPAWVSGAVEVRGAASGAAIGVRLAA